jgi:uncharacterized protein involved in outer membrane biogenesis
LVTRRGLSKAVAIIIGVALATVLGLALYLRFADLSGWRDTIAEKLSERLGREVRIAGEFKPEIGLKIRLTAGEISIANPDWCSDATMATIHQLLVDLDLWSLVSGPLTIHDLKIDGVRVLLEKNADGRANWRFDTVSETTPSKRPLDLVVEQTLVDDLQLTLNEPSRATPLNAAVTHFESTEDAAGMLEIALDGTFDSRNVHLSGRLGTLAGLLDATALEYDLTGDVDGISVSSKGDIGDVRTLSGIDVTAEVHGAELSDLRGLIELPRGLDGPFRLSAALSPATGGSGFRLDAAFAGITATVGGTVDSLNTPKVLDATVTASGPSIRTVGSLTGVADLPDDAFSVSGGFRWAGFPITFRQVEITVGENSLKADGVLGALPAMMGTDFTMHGEGPDIATIGALAGIDLPRDSYSIDGRLVRIEGGLDVEKLEARVGRAQFSAHGRMGDPPDYAGTTLSVHAEGPNIAHFNRLVGMDLPAVDFVIDGRLAQGDDAITLDDVNIRMGTATIHADGSLHTGNRLSSSTFKIDARGSDATQIMLLRGFMDLPAEPWTAAGGLTIVDSGYQLDGVSATFGEMQVQADGLIAAAKRSVGTKLRLNVEDPDLSHAMSAFRVKGFPDLPVCAAGTLRIEDGGYGLDLVTATAGDIDVAVDGLVGGGEDLDGTHAHLTVRGPQLASVGPYFHLTGLPQAPFSVVGDVRVTAGRVDLDNVVTDIDSNHVTLDGTIAPVRGLVGTDVRIDVNGPDLGRAGRLAAGLTQMPELPAEPFSLTTRLSIDEAGYEIDDLHATLDRAMAAVDGRVGTAANMVGTDLSVTADGPNSSLFSSVTGITVPVAPFKVRGRIQRTEAAFLFDHVEVGLGGHSISLHGSLGELPRLVGTELDLAASGPGTALISDLTGYHKLPDRAFSIAGHFDGTPEKFTATGLDIVLGKSDVRGSLDADIRGKPDITARLVSDQIDLHDLMRPSTEQGDPKADTTGQPTTPTTALLISDKPLDFTWMERADADIDVTVDTLQMPVERFHDVTINAQLVDGRLDAHRVTMAGSRGGSGSGSLLLEPLGTAYRGDLSLDLTGVHVVLPGEDAPDAASRPPLDIEVRLQVHGRSLHELAASANGSIQFVAGKGKLDNRALDLISQDILLTLLTAFNPFAKEQKATELQCAIALMTFKDGLATLDPMVMQSDKMTMLGRGQISFATEKLKFDWVTKPRKGIGLSASMLTNPYIKLGGTLAHPSIELKGAQAVASTGVAVATLGISLVAKGMLDRATAEKKVCKIALEEIAKRGDGSARNITKE